MMKKVAIICFDNPYLPPAEGGKKAMLSRLQCLLNLDLDLDIYLLNKRREIRHESNIASSSIPGRVFQFTMNSVRPADLLRRYPLCCEKRYVPGAIAQLSRSEYDAVFYEGEQVAPYRLERIARARQHILFFHDIESAYREELSRSSRTVFYKAVQRLEAQKFRQMEFQLSGCFDRLLFISKKELCDFGQQEKSIYVPFAVEHIAQEPIGKQNGFLLYVGDLTLPNNFESIRWFCEEVLPEIIKEVPSACLYLVGKINEKNREALSKMPVAPCIRVTGYVDDINEFFRDAALVINPVRFGAGVKIKTIEAVAHGQILVGTHKALEGTSLTAGRDSLIADQPREMAALCSRVLQERSQFLSIATCGLSTVRSEHSVGRQSSSLREIIGC